MSASDPKAAQSAIGARTASPNDDCSIHLTPDALHDLVGPANQLRSMADLILRKHREKLGDDADVLFGFMQAASDRLQLLISGLRDHTRIIGNSQPHRNFDVNDVLEGALATLNQTLQQNQAVVTHDPLPEIWGDPTQICYAFVSLIDNAIKFRANSPPKIHIGVSASGPSWLFSVCDNGIGIDPKYADRIFDVFKRVHNDSYPGAGMGLPIARRIIERHGGRIWVDSALGKGACFFFTLPNLAGGEVPIAAPAGA
uniref:histidine kinase n=1 Tax=Solibacter usitatus (strain Ellin6076) TaxID=234267 RepID=Q026N6_SOLUE